MSEPIEPISEQPKQDLKDGVNEVHAEAMKRFEDTMDRERDSRALAIEDKIMVESEGGMWDDTFETDGDTAPPPRYQIDRVTPALEASAKDQREAKIAIKVRGTSQSNKETDETMNGLIKNVETSSDADYAYDNSFDETQKCGYGGFQIVTEYADDGFEQDILIRPIKDAASSLLFGPSELYTKEDAPYAFQVWHMSKEEFKATYPDADCTDFPNDLLERLRLTQSGWYDADTHTVRMAAYWRKKLITKEIIMMVDQQGMTKVYDVDDKFERVRDDLEKAGVTVKLKPDGTEMRRKVDTYQIERYVMSGAEILKGPQLWVGKYFPLIPEFGVETVIEGRSHVRGRVRKTKDASRVYNYSVSAQVEDAVLAPKAPLMMTPTQIDGFQPDYETINVDNKPVLLWNPDPDAPPPFRADTRTLDQAMIGIAQEMKENIAVTVGSNIGVPQAGTAQDNRSGEAILQGEAITDKANGIYMTNHARTVAYGGKVLADLIPRIWSGEMQRRIIKPDGSSEFVTVNQTVMDSQTGQESMLNDLGAIKYDTATDVGPAYATRRQESSAAIQKMAETNPAFANRPDLIVKGIDLADGGEMYDDLRKQGILAGTIEPTPEETQELGIDQIQQIRQQLTPEIEQQVMESVNVQLVQAQANALNAQAKMSTQQGQASEVKAMAEMMKQQSASQSAAIKDISESFVGMKTMMESMQMQFEMGITPTLQAHDNLITQQEVVETAQQGVNQGPNTEQAEQFEQVNQPLPPGQL